MQRGIGGVCIALVVGFCGLAPAWAQEDRPLAYVTVVSGGAATRGASGPIFPADPEKFSDGESGLWTGDPVVTSEGGTAVITFPEEGVVLYLEESSEFRLDALPVVDKCVPAALRLLAGRMHVTARSANDRWLVVAGATAGGAGYTLSQGASLTATAEPSGVTFAVSAGEALFYTGNVPEGALVDADGDPVHEEAGVISEGDHITTKGEPEEVGGAAPEPDAAGGRLRLAEAAYGYGLQAGARWIAEAERGDFTPVRVAARGAEGLFRGATSAAEFAFDQPRSGSVVPAPRITSEPVRSAVTSPVQGLLQSGRPASVVIGQRLARTRIIGSPGTQGGGIRVNPNVQSLIRLSP